MSALDERIAVMKDTEIINAATAEKLALIQNMLMTNYGIQLTEENAAPFVTHIALAFERLNKNEEISPIDDFIFEEIKASEDYAHASEIADCICKMDTVAKALPESEKACIIIHLINVLASIRE